MKKIYKKIVLIGVLAIAGTSCSDWLNVYPSDQIKEEFLFETGNGYRAALNGIYRKLTSWNIYGSNLKWGIIDAWGQVYDMDLASVEEGESTSIPMRRIELLDFKHYEITPTTDNMWNDSWNIVANCNELVQQVEQADSTLFYSGEKEHKMILGEAIALRAYLQFDLLRVYAPSLAMNPDKRTFIPYINTYPAYVSNRETVSYCLEQIINDLKRAQDLLLKVDDDVRWSNRFDGAKNDASMFLASRGYRLNYYAVTAELARVYLYAGKTKEAYEQAKVVIQDSQYFTALTGKDGEQRIKDGNLKMYDDVIFALYSPIDQSDWDRLMNHSSDKSDGNDKDIEYFLGITNEMARTRYGDDLDKDWRICYQMEKRNFNDYRTLKYNQRPDSYKYGKENNALVPMLRMSEVFYIAAEAIYKENLTEAKGYLTLVKKGRGLTDDLEGVTTANFMDVLVNDALREFMGEGQTLFMFKRLMRTMVGRKGEVAANEKNMVLPLPESESDI